MSAIEKCERETIAVTKNLNGDKEHIPGWRYGPLAVAMRTIDPHGIKPWTIFDFDTGHHLYGGLAFEKAEQACEAMVKLVDDKIYPMPMVFDEGIFDSMIAAIYDNGGLGLHIHNSFFDVCPCHRCTIRAEQGRTVIRKLLIAAGHHPMPRSTN